MLFNIKMIFLAVMPVSWSRQDTFRTEDWVSCSAIRKIRKHNSLHPVQKPWRSRTYWYKTEMNVDLNTS